MRGSILPMSTQHKPETEQATNCTRRQALKLAAGATGAATVGYGADRADLQLSKGARAGLPFPDTGTIIGGTLMDLSEGIADALQGDPSETDELLLREEASWDFRRYHNSTVRELGITADTLPYVLDGVFEDAKLAAIEALNAEKTQAEVESAAKSVAKDELSTIQKNIITLGNSGLTTIKNYILQAQNASFGVGKILKNGGDHIDSSNVIVSESTPSYTLINGETKPFIQFTYADGQGTNRKLGVLGDEPYGVLRNTTNGDVINPHSIFAESPDQTDTYYPVLPVRDLGNFSSTITIPSDYRVDQSIKGMITQIEDKWQNDLRIDIENYVSNAYAEVAAGDIDPGALLSERQVANTIAEQEPANRAIAALRAAGIPVELTTLPMCHRLTSMSIVASPRSTLLGS